MMAIMGRPGAIHQASRALPACLHVLDHRKIIDKLLAYWQSLHWVGKCFLLVEQDARHTCHV